jgi:hypothetical protein
MLLVATAATPTVAAPPTSCRVRNADSGGVFGTLQAAVDAASKGDRLTVRGTCHGGTVIKLNLTIEGVRDGPGKAVLDGDDQARVLAIIRPSSGRIPRVTIRDVTIEHGRARPALSQGGYGGNVGGGIWTHGYLTLEDVDVRDNTASSGGGGIYAQWANLRLSGTTRVEGNGTDELGGGVFCFYARVDLNDSSSIAGNRAGIGGGVACWGPLHLKDSSSIAGNRARAKGGGAYLINTGLYLDGSASIRDNRSDRRGAGVFFDAYLDEENGFPSEMTLGGSSSITGNRAGSAGSCCAPGCGRGQGRAGGLWAGPALALRMTDSSAISDNQATCDGGGLYSRTDPADGGALDGVTCAPRTPANVLNNTPDDCLIEP